MAEVLREYFAAVRASDVFDYGSGYEVGSFIGTGLDVVPTNDGADWVICNPPYSAALTFADRALAVARQGVALLVRTAWMEGADRYRELFRERPPALIAQFVERVPMIKGRWDPDATTATSYAWFIWLFSTPTPMATRLVWIPPGCREGLTRVDDRVRFASWSIGSQPGAVLL
jgi:hypothetical protein